MGSNHKRIDAEIEITAPRQRIWDTLTSSEGFTKWCEPFQVGSYAVGDWSEGSTMHFLGPSEAGQAGGMATRVVLHRPGEIIRMEHFAVVVDGKETFEGEDFDTWVPSHEEYRLSDSANGYTLAISTDVPADYFEMFQTGWREALKVIKRLAEEAGN